MIARLAGHEKPKDESEQYTKIMGGPLDTTGMRLEAHGTCNAQCPTLLYESFKLQWV